MRIIGITGWSGAGKTHLIIKLIPLLRAQGLAVSTLKHAHHGFDVDVPGKDSHQHRQAGATEVLVSSGRRFALMHELNGEAEWTLPALLNKMSPVDLVLIEGFKRYPHPKIEVFRPANGKSPLYPADASIRAIAADCPLPDAGRPVYHLDDLGELASAVQRFAVPWRGAFGEGG